MRDGEQLLRQAGRETAKFEWQYFDSRGSIRCILAIALCLAAGIAFAMPREGMNAAYGAMSVGFGSFQKEQRPTTAARLVTSLAMAASVLVGSLLGNSLVLSILLVAVWSFATALLMALSTETSWIGMQAAIALFLGIAYAGSNGNPVFRAAYVLLGGLLQALILYLICRNGCESASVPAKTLPHLSLARIKLQITAELQPQSPALRFALRTAVTLAMAESLSRLMSLQNGYWVPMTALLVMKPEVGQSITRALARLLGTVAGAAIATVIVAELHPDMWVIAALIVLFAWLCYNLLLVNYAVYTVCITQYVVFLLAMAGLPTRVVVSHRVFNTLVGGGLAIALRILWPRWESKQAAE